MNSAPKLQANTHNILYNWAWKKGKLAINQKSFKSNSEAEKKKSE